MLFAFQRFTFADWGQLPEFSYHEAQANGLLSGRTLTLPASQGQGGKEMALKLLADEIRHSAYGITGRHTRAFEVQSEGYENKPIVLKLSSVGAGRTPEEALIEEARQRVPKYAAHLPVVIRSHRFEGTRTGDLRTALRARPQQPTEGSRPEAGCRELKGLVFEKLEPIYKLEGQELLRAFLDCFAC